MSKGARLREQKAHSRDPRTTPWSPPRPGEQIEVAFVPALTVDTEAAVQEMQRQTHDGLLDMLGTRRRSPIRWHHFRGRAAGETFLREAYADEAEMWAMVKEKFLPFLAEHGDAAVLVVAECDAVMPR